jgi:hypothetical protein
MAAESHEQRHRVKASNKPNKNEKKVQSYSKVESVLSPHNCTFIPRTTIQRTPRKLCTLTLPPPLSTLSDEPNAPSETQPNSNPRHKRAPSDLNSTAFSVDPSLITESSHPTPGSRYYSGASVSSPDIPSYLRIGMSCDPLIAFDLVLVATTDGRIAVYQLMDYGLEMDEDVMASERRRRSEWEEEDIEWSDVDGDEKKLTDNSFTNDDYGDDTAIERMTKRERSRECVDPLIVISLPIQHFNRSGSEEDNSNPHSQTYQVLPMVVGMYAGNV